MFEPLQLDREGSRPLYQQIADAVEQRIRAGELSPGDRLPTVRKLADDLAVTRLTVHKAFGELRDRGWTEATVGRGTFVKGRGTTSSVPSVPRARPDADRVMAAIQQLGHGDGRLNLAHAEPDPDLMPAASFWNCLTEMGPDAVSHLQYASPRGSCELRQVLSEQVSRRGIHVPPRQILVTAGATQGLSLAAQALARPGDRVIVEQPTYLGLLHILSAQGLQPIGVTTDDDGPNLCELERLVLAHRPRFFYTIPSFHNPTGRCMSVDRRRQLMELAEKHGFFIVEDDIYHGLAYDQPAPPPLKSLDDNGLVVHLDGVSKLMLPGVRAGFAVASGPLLERMVSLRRAQDLCGPTLIQRALARLLTTDDLQDELQRALVVYRARRDALLEALGREMPASVRWSTPLGGFSCWLDLPAGIDIGTLYRSALARGLVFTPGDVFMAEPGNLAHLRLCFGNVQEEQIERGVTLLAELIEQHLTSTSDRSEVPSLDDAPLV